MTELARVIRHRRKQLGHTLAELADAAGCSKAYLSGMENDRLANPPSRRVLQRIEAALDITPGELVRLADWQRTPGDVREQVARLAARSRAMAAWLEQSADARDDGGRDLDAIYRSGALHDWLADTRSTIEQLPDVCYRVPLINQVAAGYPTDFTDLEYPARVADEYVAVPEIHDAQAFAARVVGDSMTPDYREGDIIIFSPMRTPVDGDDCFIRLLPDHHTTFKRIRFVDETHVRLQPLNEAFPPRTVSLEEVSGLYPAVYRMQMLR